MSSVWLLVNSDTPAAALVAKDLEIAAATLNFKLPESRAFWRNGLARGSITTFAFPDIGLPSGTPGRLEVSSPGAKANTLKGGRK